jgi:hypothetical protein
MKRVYAMSFRVFTAIPRHPWNVFIKLSRQHVGFGTDVGLNCAFCSITPQTPYATALGRLVSVVRGSSRPKLCENALNTSKVESYGRCLRNQQTEARIALVSYIGVRKCCLGRFSGPNSIYGRSNGWIHALIASSSPEMPKMLIIRLRL